MEDPQQTDVNSALPKPGSDFNMELPTPPEFDSEMAGATASVPAPPPGLRREDASLLSKKAQQGSARSVLARAFKKKLYDPLPHPTGYIKQHSRILLDTPIGRNLDIVTTSGIEFKIHSVMTIGGPKIMQAWLYPFDAPHPTLLNRITIPTSPILVDSLVEFLYTGDYECCQSGTMYLKFEKTRFNYATFIPSGPASPEVLNLVGTSIIIFHLHMYSVGEDFKYDALMTRAYDKLLFTLTHNSRLPCELKEAIVATFAPRSNGTQRVCIDVNGDLQKLVAAAVIVCEMKVWSDEVWKEFAKSVEDPDFASFWHTFYTIKVDNCDLVKLGVLAHSQLMNRQPVARPGYKGHAHQLRAGCGGIEKRTKDMSKAKREERAKLRGDLGGEADEDEEDDEEDLANVHQRLANMSL